MAFADSLVVGVEEIAEPTVELTVSGQIRAEYELFEKPGGVCEMPFRRACVRHALHGAVLRRQGRDQRNRERPYLAEALSQRSQGRAGLYGKGAKWHVVPGGRP